MVKRFQFIKEVHQPIFFTLTSNKCSILCSFTLISMKKKFFTFLKRRWRISLSPSPALPSFLGRLHVSYFMCLAGLNSLIEPYTGIKGMHHHTQLGSAFYMLNVCKYCCLSPENPSSLLFLHKDNFRHWFWNQVKRL